MGTSSSCSTATPKEGIIDSALTYALLPFLPPCATPRFDTFIPSDPLSISCFFSSLASVQTNEDESGGGPCDVLEEVEEEEEEEEEEEDGKEKGDDKGTLSKVSHSGITILSSSSSPSSCILPPSSSCQR
jgi:hypothetical protein